MGKGSVCISSPASNAVVRDVTSRARALPVAIVTRHGWILVLEGENWASRKHCSMTLTEAFLGRNARVLCRVLTSFVKVSSSCVPRHTSSEIKLSCTLVGNDGMVMLRDPSGISRRCSSLHFERLLSDQSYPAINIHSHLNKWVVSRAKIQKDETRFSLSSSIKLS